MVDERAIFDVGLMVWGGGLVGRREGVEGVEQERFRSDLRKQGIRKG